MSEDLKIFLEDLLDFLNGQQAMIVKLKFQIEKLIGPSQERKGEKERQWSWDPGKIAWVKTEGARGTYERYPVQGEKIEASVDYKALVADLKLHKRFLQREGCCYWLFSDLATVGRRMKR